MLKRFTNLGISSSQPIFLQKKIFFSNVLVLVGIPTATAYLIFYMFFFPPLIPYLITALVLLISVSVFNIFHWHLASRLLLCSVIILLDSIIHGFAVKKGQEPLSALLLFNFTLTLLPWLVIDIKEKFLLILALIFNVLLILNQQWFIDFFETDYPNDLFKQGFFITFLLISAVGLSNVLMLVLNYRVFLSEENNHQLVEDLEKKNRLLDQQKNELSIRINELNHQKTENEHKTWLSERLNRVTSILQSHENQQNTLDKILSEVAKTVQANMGIIYKMQETPEPQLHFAAAFAPNSDKIKEQVFLLGEGLLGQCALEMKVILLNISQLDNYLISSGLGQAKPKTVVLIPAISQDKIQGVMEIASLGVLQAIQLEYLEVVGKILGNWLYNQHINLTTQKLLMNTQEQAKMLRTQEEEMRQSFEELRIIQEEMQRREDEYRKIIASLQMELENQK